MLVHKRVNENSLAAMLAVKWPAGVTPEVNLRVCTLCMPLPNANKAVYSGVSVTPQKDMCPPKFLKKSNIKKNIL